MDRMPEVYDDIFQLKHELLRSDEAVFYCTPEIARWLVDEDYEPYLTAGEAVRIEKREDGFLVVPVEWHRSPDTDLWDWVEVEQPYLDEIDIEDRFGENENESIG